MAIPAIESYPMPTEDELPENIARWTVDPDRAVLLVHDMQNYFLSPFPRGPAPATDLVRQRRDRCGSACAALGVAGRLHRPARRDDARAARSAEGLLGPGHERDPEHRRSWTAGPGRVDWVFTKWRHSAFYRPDLLDLLRERSRDQLVICGVYAHVGVLMTAEGVHPRHPAVPGGGRGRRLLAPTTTGWRWTTRRTRCSVTLSTRSVLTDAGHSRGGALDAAPRRSDVRGTTGTTPGHCSTGSSTGRAAVRPAAPPRRRPGRTPLDAAHRGHHARSAARRHPAAVRTTPAGAGARHEVLALVPYRQIAERGFACPDDESPAARDDRRRAGRAAR